jgi:hypothetical protein
MQHATDNKAPGTFLDAESLRILHCSVGSNTWQRPAQQSINRVGHCPALKFHLQLEASRQNTLMLSTPPCNIFPLASPQLWLMTVEFVNVFRCVLHRCLIKHSYAMIQVLQWLQLEQQNLFNDLCYINKYKYMYRDTGYNEFRTSSS